MLRNIFPLLLLLIFTGLLNAQSGPVPFRNDLVLMKQQLRQRYPSLYRYNTSWDQQFDSVYLSFTHRTTALECYRAIKFLLSAVKDGHLSCKPSPALDEYFSEKAKYFPVRLRFIGTKAYVWDSLLKGLPRGTEITAIDEVPVDRIRQELFRYMVSDGNIETKKQHILDNVFCFYYLLVYGEKDAFTITVKTSGGAAGKMHLDAVHEKDLPARSADAGGPLLTLAFHGNVPVLTVKTFDRAAYQQQHLDFPFLVDSIFTQLERQGADKLVIDLRGNGGGRDLYGSLLYAYLTGKPVAYYKRLATATDSLPYELFTYPSTSYHDLTPRLLERSGDHLFRLRPAAHDNLLAVKPAPHAFTGKVWFLIDGWTFSTAAELCAVARNNRRGVFIGEETGGGCQGNTSGAMQDLTLPASQVTITYGLVQYDLFVPPGATPGRGVMPDHTVQPDISDLIGHKDVQLDVAIRKAADGK